MHFISRGCNLTRSPTAFALRLMIQANGKMNQSSPPIAPTSADKTVATSTETAADTEKITATTIIARTPRVSTTTSNSTSKSTTIVTTETATFQMSTTATASSTDEHTTITKPLKANTVIKSILIKLLKNLFGNLFSCESCTKNLCFQSNVIRRFNDRLSYDITVTKLDLFETIPSHFLMKNIIAKNRNF